MNKNEKVGSVKNKKPLSPMDFAADAEKARLCKIGNEVVRSTMVQKTPSTNPYLAKLGYTETADALAKKAAKAKLASQ